MTTRFRLVLLLSLLIVSLGLMAFVPATLASEAQQTSFAAPRLVVNASFLNVRTGPGVQYAVLLTVVGGTELPVLGRANDNVWYQVSTVVGVGWVNVEFCVPRGSFENVPVVKAEDYAAAAVSLPSTLELPGQGGGAVAVGSPSVPAAMGGMRRFTLASGRVVTVNPGERFRAVLSVEAVNARVQPSVDAQSIGTLFRDDAMDYVIVGDTTDKNGIQWLALDVPDIGAGWVEAPKLFIRLSRVSGTVVTMVGTVGMVDVPGGSGTNLPVLTEGREAFLLNISRDGQFVEIELGGGERGWVPFDSVRTRTGTPTDEIDLSQIPVAAPAAVAGAQSEGQGGGQVVTSGLSVPHVVVNTGFLNIRSGPGVQYTSIATVPGGTKLAVLGMASDQVWFLVQGSFGQGWVNSEFAVFRGSIQSVPIINEAFGVLASPVAVLSGSITLYAAPGTNFGAIGTLTGPLESPVVARTADGTWLQLNSSLGYGWVLASQIQVRGDVGVVPVVG